jgi:uncharacterized phosphatase
MMNRSGIFSGRTETPLHDDGRAQAKQAGNELKDKQIDCIVASPMSRTIETAELIAHEIHFPSKDIITNELLTERDFGPLEGATYEPNLGDVEGVETIDEMLVRAAKALAFIKSLPHDNILIVSHGATGRALRSCLDPSIPYYPSKSFDNAEVVQLA